MTAFNLPDRYVLMLNLLIGVVIIPYFAAMSVIDIVKIHYADHVLPTAADSLQGPPPARFSRARARNFYDVIAHRDIFNLAPVENAPVESENLPITLIGTSQMSAGKPLAIVEDSNGSQSVYCVGQTIPGAGQLLAVEADRVLILRNGHRVALELPRERLTPGRPVGSWPRHRPHRFRQEPTASTDAPAAGVHPNGPNRYVLDRSTVDQNLRNMAPLFTQIRATPDLSNGKPDGFRLSEIQPDSIFQQIGLRDGDLLNAVNGQTVGDPVKALTLLQSLQNQSLIRLNLVRNGAPTQIEYRIR